MMSWAFTGRGNECQCGGCCYEKYDGEDRFVLLVGWKYGVVTRSVMQVRGGCSRSGAFVED